MAHLVGKPSRHAGTARGGAGRVSRAVSKPAPAGGVPDICEAREWSKRGAVGKPRRLRDGDGGGDGGKGGAAGRIAGELDPSEVIRVISRRHSNISPSTG